MKGDFVGQTTFRETPDGGMLETGFGKIIKPDGNEINGFFMKLDDANGDNVAEFAMSAPTFRAFLLSTMESTAHEAKQRLGKMGGDK